MAVDDRASKLAADVVELIAKVRHIAGGIFVTRDDLINRIDDDRLKMHVLTPPDDDLCQLIHRERLASEIPHDEIAGAWMHRHSLCSIDVLQSVDERFRHFHPRNSPPDAMASASCISQKDLPAFEGPVRIALCPSRRMPSIRTGFRGGGSSMTVLSGRKGGRSSCCSSVHASHAR